MEKTIDRRAFEVAYAIFRIAALVRKFRQEFASHLESLALELLIAGSKGRVDDARKTATSLHYLIRLGGEVGAIDHSNADIVIAELRKFDSAKTIAESDPAIIPDSELLSIFSEDESGDLEIDSDFVNDANAELGYQSTESVPLADVQIPVQERVTELVSARYSAKNNSATVAGFSTVMQVAQDRQSKILDRIKTQGVCRMRDILEVLPNTSERTLRYDLQRLQEQGLIERVGASGPSVAYRARV